MGRAGAALTDVTGRARQDGVEVHEVGCDLARLPGVATPATSGPQLAAVAVDDRWAHLRDGAFVVRDRVAQVAPVAHDRGRRLREATDELMAT